MVTILMATYNGEAYLAEQIESILAQTHQDFVLYINDDVSSDSTLAIAKAYAAKYPDKIIVSQNADNSGGSKENFIEMITTRKADYIMLSDQDDVWLPEKIELTLAKMKETEKAYPNTPILVHTDLKIVNQDLEVLEPSYRRATSRNYNRMAFRQVLTLNNVSGCTAMYNRRLADLLNRKPKYCVMHDWWLQLVGASFGKIAHVDRATILYRQHGGNAIGATNVRSIGYKLRRLADNSHIRNRINSTYPQAESLLRLYESELTEEQKNILKRFIAIPSMKKLNRLQTICNLGVFMDGFSRNVAYFLFV